MIVWYVGGGCNNGRRGDSEFIIDSMRCNVNTSTIATMWALVNCKLCEYIIKIDTVLIIIGIYIYVYVFSVK